MAKLLETYLDRYVISGGIMMIFLIPCSFFAVWFIVQGWINLRRSRIAPSRLAVMASGVENKNDLESLRKIVDKNDAPLGRIIRRLLELKPAPPAEELEEITAELIDDEVSRLYHKNNQLAVIYTISPLLGLLGTILGMMDTFYVFSSAEEQSIAQLSIGINQALVTTMWGLAIAIPSFVVLYLFKQRLFYYEMTFLPGKLRDFRRKYPVIMKSNLEEKAEGESD